MRRHEPRQRWSDDRDDDRVRVLIECGPADSPSIIASTVGRAGYAVRTCNGPGEVSCDLDRRGACDLVDGADVVVNLLAAPEGPQLAARIAALRRPPAVVAQVPPAAGAPPGPDGGTVVTVRAPVTRRALLDAISRALGAPGPASGSVPAG